MAHQMIQVFKPSLGQEELTALAKIFESGWIGLGPKTTEFERAFARYVDTAHAVAVNSATAALHLACLALGVGPGDEVLVPAISFVSTAHAPAYCGATPVFVDVDPVTLNIDPEDAARKITRATKAMIPVHYGGHACDMAALWEIAEQHDLQVIEDAAHACGSQYGGRPIGGLSRSAFTSFSFQAVKNLPVGDGGMLTFQDPAHLRKLHQLRWCGIDKSTWERTEDVLAEDTGEARRFAQYGWYYEIHDLGYKYHMNDIAAVIGLEQLKKLPAANARRRELALAYTSAFADVSWVQTPIEHSYTSSAWHNYVIRVPERDRLNTYLKEKQIATGVHYMPLHLQPYYRRRDRVALPVAERVWQELLTLPLYPALTDEQQAYIIETLREFPG